MFTPDLESIVSRARVRIAQAAQLIDPHHSPALDHVHEQPEAYLRTADALWRELAALRDAGGTSWNSTQVDGLRGEQIIDRLNDIVYELLRAATGDILPN
jgi:hypothetical protein